MILRSEVVSKLPAWLSAEDTDELYDLLHDALWLVIIGVIIEEWRLLRHIATFVRYSVDGRFREARAKAWSHKGEIAEGVGFTVLVLGLGSELIISPLIEVKQKAEKSGAMQQIAEANAATARLMRENIELERALVTREVDAFALARDANPLPRVPLFVVSSDRGEPQDIASQIVDTLTRRTTPRWGVTSLPPEPVGHPGILIQYVPKIGSSDTDAQRVATTLCQSLMAQNLHASTLLVLPYPAATELPASIPPGSVVLQVGPQPNLDWVIRRLRDEATGSGPPPPCGVDVQRPGPK